MSNFEVEKFPDFEKALQELLVNHGDNIVAVLGYGSNFCGHNTDHLSIYDLMIIARDTKEFHEKNLQNRPQDYWKLLSYPKLQAWLNKFGFNYIQSKSADDKPFKYPVASLDSVEADCFDDAWSYYATGRLQKTFHVLHLSEDKVLTQRFEKAVEFARNRGLISALLMMPDEFNFIELLNKIVSLSYLSDVRIEDPNKVANIVEKTRTDLEKIYKPLFDALAADPINPYFRQTGEGECTSLISADGRKEIKDKFKRMRWPTAFRNYIKNPLSNMYFFSYSLAKVKKFLAGRRKRALAKIT